MGKIHFLKTIKDKETYLGAVLSALGMGVVVVNERGIIESCNEYLINFLGYKAKDLIGKPLGVLLSGKIKADHSSFFLNEELHNRVIGKTREMVILKADGNVHPVEVMVNKFEDDGEIKFVTNVIDLIEKEKSQKESPKTALQEITRKYTESEGKYQSLFDKSEDPMWVIDKGEFILSNEAAVRVLGYSSSEELQNTHPSKLSPEIQEDGRTSFEKAEKMMGIAMTQGFNRFEWVHQRKNGENFTVEVTLTRIPFENDFAIFCVWRDISARKDAEKQILIAKDQAEKASRAKSSFLANMSHELRTPLNAVMGFSDAMLHGMAGPLSKKQKIMISDILLGGKQLLTLVEDLLNMTQIENDEIDLNNEHFSILPLMQQSAKMVQTLAETNKIKIHLPKTSAKNMDVKVFADIQRTLQIFINFLTNAIKYNTLGGNIWLSIESVKNGKVRLSVKDDGIGIEVNKKNDIFEKFNRGGKENLGVEGTGLGLSIVKSLITLMQGSVSYESEVGKGTIFRIELPNNPPK